MSGYLKIKVVEGRKFDTGINSSQLNQLRPIVQIKLKYESESTKPSQIWDESPKWNEIFDLHVYSGEQYFDLYVYDGEIKKEKLLGETRIGIITFKDQDKLDNWFPFYFIKKKKYHLMGEIHIIGKFVDENHHDEIETDPDFILNDNNYEDNSFLLNNEDLYSYTNNNNEIEFSYTNTNNNYRNEYSFANSSNNYGSGYSFTNNNNYESGYSSSSTNNNNYGSGYSSSSTNNNNYGSGYSYTSTNNNNNNYRNEYSYTSTDNNNNYGSGYSPNNNYASGYTSTSTNNNTNNNMSGYSNTYNNNGSGCSSSNNNTNNNNVTNDNDEDDPDLALALKLSLDEEKLRQEAAKSGAISNNEDFYFARALALSIDDARNDEVSRYYNYNIPRSNSPQRANISIENELDEDEVFARAIALSLAEVNK